MVRRADGGSDKELRTQRSAGTAAPSPGRAGGGRGVWEVRLAVQDARGSPAPAGLRRLFQRPVLLSGPKLPPGSRAGVCHPSSPTLAVQIPVPGGRKSWCAPCWAVWGRPGVRGRAALAYPVSPPHPREARGGDGGSPVPCGAPPRCSPQSGPTWSSVCIASPSSLFRRHGLILHCEGVGVIIISITYCFRWGLQTGVLWGQQYRVG